MSRKQWCDAGFVGCAVCVLVYVVPMVVGPWVELVRRGVNVFGG